MIFFVGLHQPSDAKYFERAFISVNRLRSRRMVLGVKQWIMDSGAFTEISTHGRYRASVEAYAAEANRWTTDHNLLAVVSQDYMCEPHILEKTGLTVVDHQRLTIERYDALLPLINNVHLMPVLQGYATSDYIWHIKAYGNRLRVGAWVGVGSICKRNTTPIAVENILHAIKLERSDLRLHGFGLKTTALASSEIRKRLYSADSMAWSFAARREGRNQNDRREAQRFIEKIEAQA